MWFLSEDRASLEMTQFTLAEREKSAVLLNCLTQDAIIQSLLVQPENWPHVCATANPGQQPMNQVTGKKSLQSVWHLDQPSTLISSTDLVLHNDLLHSCESSRSSAGLEVSSKRNSVCLQTLPRRLPQ